MKCTLLICLLAATTIFSSRAVIVINQTFQTITVQELDVPNIEVFFDFDEISSGDIYCSSINCTRIAVTINNVQYRFRNLVLKSIVIFFENEPGVIIFDQS